MWLLYVIRVNDGFRQLSVIADNLQDIYDFITEITRICPDDFYYEIIKEK